MSKRRLPRGIFSAGAPLWRVSWHPGPDGIERPSVLDRNGAVLLDVKLGYGEDFARDLAHRIAVLPFIEAQRRLYQEWSAVALRAIKNLQIEVRKLRRRKLVASAGNNPRAGTKRRRGT